MASSKRKEAKPIEAELLKKVSLSANSTDHGGIETFEDKSKGARSEAAKRLLKDSKE